MVAVETWESVAIAAGVKDIEILAPVGNGSAAHLAGCADRVKGCSRNAACCAISQSAQLIANGWISLLKQKAYFAKRIPLPAKTR
jgi:hypothetical protein